MNAGSGRCTVTFMAMWENKCHSVYVPGPPEEGPKEENSCRRLTRFSPLKEG